MRKISYRGLVRTLMVFPLFGPLYLAFGLYYVLLPNGPLFPVIDFFGIKPTTLLYSEAMTVFGMALFTFPFMTMNVAAALSQHRSGAGRSRANAGSESAARVSEDSGAAVLAGNPGRVPDVLRLEPGRLSWCRSCSAERRSSECSR